MIINHNLMAMNTHRQLGMNQTNSSKSMERLSSGMRINRAGDDAAGLAISEKMRGQIRGLKQAQRNAQDGISLIQTAEGALNETHAILQRMRELATQASNGTNTETDRAEIQKEMNQLTSEINRIGNTTEFNTQKLLDGGKQIDANAAVSGKALIGGLDAGVTNATATEYSTGVDQVLGSLTSGDITLSTTDTSDSSIAIGDITVYITWNETAGEHAAGNVTNVNGSEGTVDLVIDRSKSQANAASAIAAALQAVVDDSAYAGVLAGATFSQDENAVDVTLGAGIDATTANALKFELTQGTASDFAIAQNGKDITDQVNASVAGAVLDVDAVAANGNITFSGVAAEGTNITIADKKIAFYDSASGNFADADAAKSALTADMVVDINGITSAEGMAQAVVQAVNNSPIAGFTVAVDGSTPAQINVDAVDEGAFGGTTFLSKTDVASDVAATGSVTFSSVPTEDAQLSIGDTSIGFFDSSSGTYSSAEAAKEALGTDFIIDTNGMKTANDVKNAVMALDPQITSVSMASGGVGKIDITASTAGAAGNTIALDASDNDTSGFTAKFQIGANTGQSMTIEVNDMRSAALGISTTDSTEEKTVTVDGKDYGVAWTTTNDVTNGTDNQGVEHALDVSTHENATAAVKVLDDAINTVSAERSKLGAFQNRLEHTISNLGTSAENLQAAESRIRDLDMAEEMMAFTKNNILQQAATAMLAQANMAPQSVLQLLG
jgi:flagellin